MTNKRKARTLRLTEQDYQAIAALKEYYGLTSENEVIRMALRMALREMQRTMDTPPSPQTRTRIPPPG